MPAHSSKQGHPQIKNPSGSVSALNSLSKDGKIKIEVLQRILRRYRGKVIFNIPYLC